MPLNHHATDTTGCGNHRVGMLLFAQCYMTRYPAFQNAALDQEDENHQLTPGAWRNDEYMQGMDNIVGGNRTTRAAKAQRIYLTQYYNSPAGAVSWQNNMI